MTTTSTTRLRALLRGGLAISALALASVAVIAAETAAPAATTTAAAEEAIDEVLDAEAIAAQEKEVTVIAKDLSPVVKPIYELGDDDKGKQIKVDAWVDKKTLTYNVGDSLTVYAAPKSDAYITILNVGSSGRVAVLYPNHFQRELKIKGGKTIRIPGKKAKWTIDVGGPAGVDLIKVIASKNPLTIKELEGLAGADEKNPFLTLNRTAEEMAKDLTPQLKPESGDAENPGFGVRNILVRVKKT